MKTLKSLGNWILWNGFLDSLLYFGIMHDNSCVTLGAILIWVNMLLSQLALHHADKDTEFGGHVRRASEARSMPHCMTVAHDMALAFFLAWYAWPITAAAVCWTMVNQAGTKNEVEKYLKKHPVQP